MRVDANGPSSGFIHALKDDENVFDAQEPKGEGGEYEPKTVNDGTTRKEHKKKGEGVCDVNMGSSIDECGEQNAEAQKDVCDAPDANLRDADEKLCITGFGERKVEGALAHIFHELRHAGLNDQADDAPHKHKHTE